MSLPRVKPPVDLAQALTVDMGIDLGSADIHMAKHLLNTPKIRPPAEQVGRETVA